MANYPSKIIDGIFGGARQMSRDLTVPEMNKAYAASTIQSWKDAGYIPAQHHEWILQRGMALGKSITPADFFDLPESAQKGEISPQPQTSSDASSTSKNCYSKNEDAETNNEVAAE